MGSPLLLQAAVLVCGQAPNLWDAALFADPLFAVSGAHAVPNC